ncbi:hypothetical protein [Dechloromonas sp. H13]|uniref:hypothetical protein n=1 Tax=Dechloromonas sp. H13 TaxID=2570193 RepID=UPI001292696E|nr:hypothetical protein [Dechloromonas sp. H13]
MTLRLKPSKILIACAVGVSVQFFASSLETLLFGHVVHKANADGEGAQTEFGSAGLPNMALAERSGLSCEAAKRRALTVAPELLALADWPLDDHLPAECSGLPHPMAAIGDAEPDTIDVAAAPSEASVLATLPGDQQAGAKRSSIRQAAADRQHPLGQQLAAVDSEALDQIRGGFEIEGSGLKFSIGIERAVFINGNLVASTVLVPKDLQATSGGASAPSTIPAASTGGLAIVQNGTGNNVSAQINPNMAGTIIQNTLNDQKIQNVTTINATVNSLQTMRAMSVHNTIQTGIISSLRR